MQTAAMLSSAVSMRDMIPCMRDLSFASATPQKNTNSTIRKEVSAPLALAGCASTNITEVALWSLTLGGIQEAVCVRMRRYGGTGWAEKYLKLPRQKQLPKSIPAMMSPKDFSVNAAKRDRCVYRCRGEGFSPHTAYTNT